jgi:hypothetical protein
MGIVTPITLPALQHNMITVYCIDHILIDIYKKPDANLYQRQILLTKQINRSAKTKTISNFCFHKKGCSREMNFFDTIRLFFNRDSV